MKKELILKKATFNIKLKILEILFEKVWGGSLCGWVDLYGC